MLERLPRGSAGAAADDQHAPGRGVSGESGMHEVLVIDELLLLGGHVEPVEPEELAVVRRVVDLHPLEARLPFADLTRCLDVEAGGGIERLGQQMLAAVDLVPRHLGRLEVRHDRVEQLSRLGGVVGAVVADVDVERQPLALGPGMDREGGLGEHQAAPEARALELMEAHADGGEAGGLHQPDALGAEFLPLEKELRIAAAAGQVADKMQTVHSSTPQNAKAQPAVKKSGLRLPFAPCGAKQRCAIALNSCKTS